VFWKGNLRELKANLLEFSGQFLGLGKLDLGMLNGRFKDCLKVGRAGENYGLFRKGKRMEFNMKMGRFLGWNVAQGMGSFRLVFLLLFVVFG
jgi:hypothetical protein